MRKKMLSKRLLLTIVAVMLIAAMSAPVLASPATGTRTLSASVASGAEFDVAIEASGCGFAGQVVETLPDGFAYLSHTPSDIGVEQVSNTVKFTFLGDSASVTYRVKAPTVDTTITYTFHGVVKDGNKNEYPIEDNDITVTAPGTVTYTFTMEVDGNGSTVPPVGSHTYDAETVVDISAIPASGWRFGHWLGNVADPSSSSTTITMDDNKTVTAYFVQVSGTRTLPSSVASGAEFDVAIEASGCGFAGQVVETLPGGFTYVSSSLPADQVEQMDSTVKFTFLGDSASFTYRVKTPRVAATTTYTFQGVVLDEDRISYPIEDNEITVFEPSGTRTLPSSVASGAEFDVAIEASGCGFAGQVVETLPGGFSYVSSSLPADQVEQMDSTVKFTFIGDSASFTYRVKTPRVAATTTYTFQGVVLDEDRISYSIEDNEITVLEPSGTRTLPSSVASGAEFDIAIEASGCGFAGQVVETLPDGFTYISRTPSDIGVEQVGNTVKFTFLGDSASFTYRVKAAKVAATTYTFHGAVKDEDRISYHIEDNEITVTRDRGGRGRGGSGTALSTTTSAVGSINIAPYLDALNKTKRKVILKSNDDKIVLTIPKGIKVSVTSLSVAIMPTSPLPPADHILVGSAYELKPDGATFAAAVTVAISYDVDQISKNANELVIACYDKESGNWQKLTTTVDTTAHKATALVAHFTPFAILARLPAAPAAFSASNLSIQPVQVQPNEAVTISVSVANIGGTEGSYTAVLKINGLKEAEKTVTIAAGGSQTVTFSITKEVSGSYTVTVDKLSSSFTVAMPPLARGINWPLAGGIIGGVIIVGLLIFFLVRRRV